jgi:hypothetical protein
LSIATAATTVIAADITDVTVSTGPQLKKRLDEASAQENVGAAMRFFADRKLEPDTRNLSDIRFRADGETYDMFFCTIWRTDADSSRGRTKIPGVIGSRSKGITGDPWHNINGNKAADG